MDRPLVSIIIPAYNVQEYISKCICSALEQEYANIEVIIVNDGSTDDTEKKIIQYLHDDRIKYIFQNNAGVSSARNRGLDNANGKYVLFIDGDDYLSPLFTDYFVKLAEENDTEMFISLNCISDRNHIVDSSIDNIRILNSEDSTALLISPRVVVGCWNKIYRKSFLDENGIRFREDLFHGEGLYFITECSQKAHRVGVCEKPLYFYRRNNSSSATTNINLKRLLNGEKSLLEIENKLVLKDSQKINEVLLLHKCLYWLNCIVQLINTKKQKECKNEFLGWKGKFCFNYSRVKKIKNVNKYYKLMLFAGRHFPHFLSYLIKKKREKDRANSPE